MARLLNRFNVFQFLGVQVNDTLTWSDHINFVCSKVSRSLNLLRCLSWFLPQSLLLLFLKSYILPTFDYCDIVWSGCTKQESHRLETLLNFSCRTVLRRRRTIQLQLLDVNLGCLLWLLGGNSTPPKWSSSVYLQTLPHISPSFSRTQLLTITLTLPHLLSLIIRQLELFLGKVF